MIGCEEAVGKVYNIGSTEEISIERLADTIIDMTGSSSKKEFVTYEKAYGRPIEDMARRVPNVERIKEAVGWEAKTDLRQALQLIIESL